MSEKLDSGNCCDVENHSLNDENVCAIATPNTKFQFKKHFFLSIKYNLYSLSLIAIESKILCGTNLTPKAVRVLIFMLCTTRKSNHGVDVLKTVQQTKQKRNIFFIWSIFDWAGAGVGPLKKK